MYTLSQKLIKQSEKHYEIHPNPIFVNQHTFLGRRQ